MMLGATSRRAGSKFGPPSLRHIDNAARWPAPSEFISSRECCYHQRSAFLNPQSSSTTPYEHAAITRHPLNFGVEPTYRNLRRHKSYGHGLTLLANTSLSFRALGLPSSPLKHFLYSRARRKSISSELETRRYFSDRKEDKSISSTSSKAVSDPNTRSKAPEDAADVTASGSLLDRLPDLSQRFQRPTKEELLAAATGFWSRLRIRFKWFSIRSLRPFNMDDISAFFSWFLVGHVIWIILGTTTFFSLVILTINTVFAQETLARWVGNYLTKSSGVKVIFESAIVPKWKDGVITLKKVFVSRRPGLEKGKVVKGSQISAAVAAAAAPRAIANAQPEEEDTNYTQFDLSIETVNVTLSFTKWFNGKGLLRDVEVKGIRGVVDRTSVHYSDDYVDPRSYKHQHNPGDFELESFKMEDLLVSVYQTDHFRPFSVSIFSCDLPQLRKQWLFYDFLSANHVSGSFDDSLFTIHPRQTHNYTGAQLIAGTDDHKHWKKQSRIRIDGLKIDHLNRGYEGPFSWIHEGNVDIVADVMFPVENDESIVKVMTDFYDRMEATVTSKRHLHVLSQSSETEYTPTETVKPVSETAEKIASTQHSATKDSRFLVMDLRVHLNDVRAAVPLFTHDISYVNNALIRPIVAYINSKKAFIPVNCRVVKRANDFDGSWTIYDSGLMEDLSHETYEAFARDVVDDQARMRRIKKVGLWSLQLAVQALFLGLAGNMA